MRVAERESNATQLYSRGNNGEAKLRNPGPVIQQIRATCERRTKPQRRRCQRTDSTEIAASQFHTYNHALAFTTRFVF